MTDALGRVTNYQYDDFNRLVKTTYPPATTGATRLFESVEYDAASNVTRRTDTDSRSTNYLYDSANRLTRVTDPLSTATNFEYNARSQMTALVDALNQRYESAYDSLGRVTQTTRAGVSMSYAYDAVGNRNQRTDYNSVVTNYAYDGLNRLTTITYPSNQTVGYVYDALSRLNSATNANGTVALNYDNRSRVVSTSDVFNQTIGYSYDANGNRVGMSLNGSPYAGYAYDSVNRLTTLADSANLGFNYSYDASNRLISRSAPNGVTTSYAYDGLNRLATLTHSKGATTLINNQYTYNDAKTISSWANALGNHGYSYDAVDRLTSATNSAQPNESYAYDAVGNRTASHLSATYGYQTFNKLTSTATTTYSYDNNGNLISKTDSLGTWMFTYDEENRLAHATIPTGPTVNYKYDGLGRRIQRSTSTGASERYVYDGLDALADLNADWSINTTYLNDLGADRHLRQTSPTGVSYFLTDHLGSTSALTDASGTLIEQTTYDSFGNGPNSTRTRYGFTGRERDPDTGLYSYRSRWYDPGVGRFVSQDPIRLLGGINWYDYVDNNPLSWIDPFGWAKFYYWPAHDASKFGHVSLLLDDGTYISYWPSCRLPKDNPPWNTCPPRPPDYDKDFQGEGGMEPLNIQIDGLDEAAIKRWWNNGKGHGDFGDLNNCSDIVSEALRMGGLPIGRTTLYTTPDYIKDEVERLLHNRRYPPPIPQPAPTPCPRKCR